MEILTFDLAVIGAGEAGIAAAVEGAERGANVGLIEKSSQLGGACVATGTLPSKTFSISAAMLDLAQKLKGFGVVVEGQVRLDYAEVQASRYRLTRCDQGVIQSHLRSHKVQLIQGSAHLAGPSRIAVQGTEGKTLQVESPRIVLATGSLPTELPGLPTNGRTILSTDELVYLPELPQRLLIVGAGVIGCEYAFIYKTFGVDIVLAEKLDHALTGQDKDVVAAIERELKRRGIRFVAGTTLTHADETPEGRLAAVTDKGERIETDKAVICTGRRAATEHLNLAAAGVELGTRGEVLVNSHLETSATGVFAAGDVLGRRMLSSIAILEGAVAAENALGGCHEVDERFVPSGIYTQPEIGAVGLIEDEAARQGIPVLIGKCPYAGLVKACALNAHAGGFIKLIFERGSHRLLGGHILGTDAAEIIHLLVVCLRLGSKAEDFVYSIYHHPSISEGFREAARDALREAR